MTCDAARRVGVPAAYTSGSAAGAAPAFRADDGELRTGPGPDQGGSIGERRHATLRRPAASQTATACRGSLKHHGHGAGEGAR
ncbi:DUF6380 family protein [Streptomyces acidicola]|uniref:DUF6380 family protein n=1 Tax=Streptomyces acidicola TaxID=2596892 RepID=UPI00389A21C4